jgi:hypothetical protein
MFPPWRARKRSPGAAEVVPTGAPATRRSLYARGSDSYDATIITSEDPRGSSVAATIDLASIDTGNEMRHNHLRSAEYPDVEKYPPMSYCSTARGGWVIDGELTLHGVTLQVPLAVQMNGFGPDQFGGQRAGFFATAQVSRREFGIDLTGSTAPASDEGSGQARTTWSSGSSRLCQRLPGTVTRARAAWLSINGLSKAQQPGAGQQRRRVGRPWRHVVVRLAAGQGQGRTMRGCPSQRRAARTTAPLATGGATTPAPTRSGRLPGSEP